MSEEREATQELINAYRDACESEQRVVKLADFEAGWQAARQSAGATGQEPVEALLKDLLTYGIAVQRIAPADFLAAPIGDNGANEFTYTNDAGEQGLAFKYGNAIVDKRLGTEPTGSQPAESKRVELMESHLDMCRRVMRLQEQGAVNDAKSMALDVVEFILARAQAKGE